MTHKISEKLLPRRPQELGKIKIGRRSDESYTARGTGRSYRRPIKLDHFEITTREREGADGDFKRDETIHATIGDKPVELDVRLMYREVEENFQSQMVEYAGRTKVRECDGVTCRTIRTGEMNACARQQEGSCKCKPYGRLSVMLEASQQFGGFHVFRTTSWETVNNLQSALEMFRAQFGDLAWLPCQMVLYPSTDSYREAGETKSSLSYKVGLVVRGPVEAALNEMRKKPTLEQLPPPEKHIEVVQAIDVTEETDIADEFFADQQQQDDIAIVTEERRPALVDKVVGVVPKSGGGSLDGVPAPTPTPSDEFDRLIKLLRPDDISDEHRNVLYYALTGQKDREQWTDQHYRVAIKKLHADESKQRVAHLRRLRRLLNQHLPNDNSEFSGVLEYLRDLRVTDGDWYTMPLEWLQKVNAAYVKDMVKTYKISPHYKE